jgi:hypothetical protein
MAAFMQVRAYGLGLLAGLLVAGCTVPPAPVFRADAQPLGRTWTYRVSDLQGLPLGQIVSKIIAADGTKLTQETNETYNGVTTTRLSTATFQPDGSLIVVDGDGKVSPLPSIRQRLTPGASWVNPDGSTVTVEAQESITVPAGNYIAFRLKQRLGVTTTIDWFYPAIGLIKEQSSDSLVELVSVRP